MKMLRLLLPMGLFLSGIWLYFKISDPFGMVFWILLCAFLILLTCGFVFFAWLLFQKQKIWLRLFALAPAILGISLLFMVVSLIVDYRWILPGFPKRPLTSHEWNSDYQSFKLELLQHPAFKDSLTASFLHDSVLFDLLNEDESLIACMKLAGKLRDGHTYVHPLQAGIKAKYFPLQGYWFDDGYVITRASAKYKQLIGQKLIAVNNTSVKELFSKIDPLIGSDNLWQSKRQFDLYVFSTNVLHGLKVIKSTSEAVIESQDVSGTRIKTIVASEPFFTWFFWALKPIDSRDLSPAKFNLRKPNYYFEIDAVHRSLIIPVHAMQNEKNDSFVNFAERLDATIDQGRFEKIVVDLRNNGGGNNQIYQPLIAFLTKHSKGHKIYVLISRKTFSAALNFISELRNKTNINLVGEPTGAGPNHYGDADSRLLPHSRISYFISTQKWEFDSLEKTRTFIPDIPVIYTYSDYQIGIDPWLNAVVNDYDTMGMTKKKIPLPTGLVSSHR